MKYGHLSTKPFRKDMVLISNVTISRTSPKAHNNTIEQDFLILRSTLSLRIKKPLIVGVKIFSETVEEILQLTEIQKGFFYPLL